MWVYFYDHSSTVLFFSVISTKNLRYHIQQKHLKLPKNTSSPFISQRTSSKREVKKSGKFLNCNI